MISRQIIENRIDKQIAITLAALYFIHFINNVAKSILPIPELMWNLISLTGFAIGGILLLTVLPKAIRRYTMVFFVAEAAGILLYCVSIIQNQGNLQIVWDRAFWTLGICIPMGFMAYAVFDKQILYAVMLKASYFMTILISLVFFFNWFSSPGSYDMTFSYSLLYPLLFHLNALFNDRKAIHLILSLFQISLIVLYGSRGAVLCFSAFTIIKVVLKMKSPIHKVAIIGFGGVTAILLYLYFIPIGNFVLNTLAQKGYYSRTLVAFFNGSITSSSGRDSIQEKALEMIMEKPLAGWGAGGEVAVIGTYPHNIFIEILLNTGVLMGSLLCLMIALYVASIFFLREGPSRDLIFIYLCAGFIPLLLSSTYLIQYEFFIFMLLTIQANVIRVGHLNKPSESISRSKVCLQRLHNRDAV